MSDTFDMTNVAAIADAVKKNDGKPIAVQIYFLHGIFGELPDCNGVAEEVIDTDEKLAKYGLDPKDGGTYIKLVGCSYLYKGDPNQAKVYGLEQAKSNISTVPRQIIAGSWLYSAAVILRALFQLKKFINDLHVEFGEIRWKTMIHCAPPDIRLGCHTREIRRAMDVAVKKEFGIDPGRDLFGDAEPGNPQVRFTKYDLAGLIVKMTAFITLIADMDGAYGLPERDIFAELDTENVRKNGGAAEALRLIGIWCERGVRLGTRITFIRKILRPVLWLSPRANRILTVFFLELNESKVSLDDADWYFCLRRNTYNFRGVSLEVRLEELKRIDADRGHQYVKIEYIPQPQPVPAAEPAKP